jgi:beta-glucosidase
MRPSAVAALLLLFSAMPERVKAQTCSSTQTAQQIDARIDTLIGQMTIPERIAQLQDRAPAIERLGVPAYNWWNEGLHGLARNGYATVFPQAIGLAATFDKDLLRNVGETVSTEARAKFNMADGRKGSPRYGGLTLWSPNINIFRDPRWGRGQETYGEDPFLTATMGTAFVAGVQGRDAFYRKADATPKHFAAHSGPEDGRDSFHANASAHDLADTYLPAFHALLTDGRADALMCSYNAIDGTPSCANRLVAETVRTAWNFKGYIVSDCDAVGNLTEYQHYTPDAAHGAAAALNAGVDLDCGNSYLPLKDALSQRLTTEETIDRALHRLLLARVRLGLLDPSGCTPYDAIGAAELDSPEHRTLARHAAEESIVLLQNDGTLPLRRNQRIAVIGANADAVGILEANYHGTASHPVTQFAGLSEALPNLRYAQGALLAEGVAAPIPRTALRVASEQGAASGLRAEYFSNDSFTGTPAVTGVVPTVDLDLDRVAPSPQLAAAHYSARWTGFFVPPAPGDYTLHVAIERCWDCTTHDRFRLYLDGTLALDNDGSKSVPDSYTLHAVDTNPHTVRLELAHTGEDEGIALEWIPPADALLDEAVRAARDADVIIAFAGLSPELEGEALQVHLAGFNGGDRTSLDLPEAQRRLLRRLQALHKKLVIVLNSGSAVALNPADYGTGALLEAWYPGEEGGHALAEILTGSVSPSGRLPVTFYRSVDDLPAFTDYTMARRTYRYFPGPVLFPFGSGLGYAHIDYGAVTLSKGSIHADEPLTATVTLHNDRGPRASEVAELYIVPPQTDGAPHVMLQGVQRVTLAPGESRNVTFALGPGQLSTVNEAGERAVQPGTYHVYIGSGQPDPTTTQGTSLQVSAAQD